MTLSSVYFVVYVYINSFMFCDLSGDRRHTQTDMR